MTLLGRALRGIREHARTHIASTLTVGLALFCLAGAILMLENAGALSARWGAPVRMTVYLADGANAAQVEALRSALADLPEVSETRYVSPSDARAQMFELERDGTLANASVDLFPATLEIRLAPTATNADRLAVLGARVRRLPTVSDVETYRGLSDQMRGVLQTARTLAFIIALIVMLCATAVVGNTVRLSLSSRMREVEVLRMVGATRQYVRAPFLVEGALLGGVGAIFAIVAIAGVFFSVRARFHAPMTAILGMSPAFLSAWIVALFVAGGCALGVTGSAVALRRWLAV